MPTSTRIKGRNLVLTLDGVDYAVDASSILLTNEDKDGAADTTFVFDARLDLLVGTEPTRVTA